MPDIGMYTPHNVFQFPRSNAFHTHNFTYICLTPRQLYHPLQQLKSFPHICQHPHMSPFHYMLMPRSLHRGRTPVAPERVFLSAHRLNKEAKSMKNGLSKSHPSKLGMLSSAFIHFCDLSRIWHLVSLAELFLGSHGIGYL